MKKIVSFAIFMSAFLLISTTLYISAFAADNSVGDAMLISTDEIVPTFEDIPVISYGLNVIANKSGMAVAGIKGRPLDFNPDKFACAMNLARVDYITVTRLPDSACGGLYIGGDAIRVGQRINAADISRMSFEEGRLGKGKSADFGFTVNGSAYEMTCNIYMLSELNYSPTVSLAPAASLNSKTYENIDFCGVMTAYDPEGDELTFEVVSYPEHGSILVNDKNNGTYTYSPADSYTGKDSFVYVVRDKYGNYSAGATVSIDVMSSNISSVYADMDENGLYSYAIKMTESGIMSGTKVGQHYYFEPDREVTRAEFVVNCMNAVGIDDVPTVTNTGFADDGDIKPEMKGYIFLAYSKGYISGSGSGGQMYFKPDEKITISEAAVIVSNMIGYTNAKYTTVFADQQSIPSWSSKAIVSLHSLGILETPNGVVGAGETVCRGDMAKLLARTMAVLGR